MRKAIISVILLASACTPKVIQSEDPHFNGCHICGYGEESRIGAQCQDGIFSKATGSGACSGHGGVDQWLCK